MTDLLDFLLARLEEDEEAARGVLPGYVVARDPSMEVARYIARWDPMRVLAECQAKRSVVELHRTYTTETPADFCAVCLYTPPCETLCLLALPYADHPDYHEEWRP